MKLKLWLLMILTSISTQSFAGELIRDAEITALNNVSNNEEMFTIWFSSGIGPCSENGFIKFPLSESPTKETHARAYSAALTALTTGMSIKVHNYSDDNCEKASYIKLTK